MPPKKCVASDSAENKEAMTVKIKKEIDKHESGVRVTELANIYRRPTSTIWTILKKEEIKLDVAKGVTVTSKHRPKLLEDVEKLLLMRITEKQLNGNSVPKTIIYAKAKMFLYYT
ncbi:hypothetical protein FHG87_011838 [Trinorchestia longiramus]|nr:hypothetical protein FHG87_011838 [Trinorchestia longiramus]